MRCQPHQPSTKFASTELPRMRISIKMESCAKFTRLHEILSCQRQLASVVFGKRKMRIHSVSVTQSHTHAPYTEPVRSAAQASPETVRTD